MVCKLLEGGNIYINMFGKIISDFIVIIILNWILKINCIKWYKYLY